MLTKCTPNNERGFTLIELVMVIIVISILASFAVVRYVDVKEAASAPAPQVIEREVQAAFAGYLASNYNTSTNTFTYPDVTTLAELVNGANVTAVSTGIQSVVNGTTYVIKTYTDTKCTTATTAVANQVKCVGKYN